MDLFLGVAYPQITARKRKIVVLKSRLANSKMNFSSLESDNEPPKII